MTSHNNAIHRQRIAERDGDPFQHARRNDHGNAFVYRAVRFDTATRSRFFARIVRRAKWIVLGLVAFEAIGAAGMLVRTSRLALIAENDPSHSRKGNPATVERENESQRPWRASWYGLRTVRPDADRDAIARRAHFDFQAVPGRFSIRPFETLSGMRSYWPWNPIDADVPIFVNGLEDSCLPE
jgi:hypothetical protein